MDVYRQAGSILHQVKEGRGTIKGLVLAKETQKKKQTYAVVCETYKNYDLLEATIQHCELLKHYPTADFYICLAMAYDALLGRGVSTTKGVESQAFKESLQYLQSSFDVCQAKFPVNRGKITNTEELGEDEEGDEDGERKRTKKHRTEKGKMENGVSGSNLPKWARFNPLAAAHHATKPTPTPTTKTKTKDDDNDDNKAPVHTSAPHTFESVLATVATTHKATRDKHIPNLIRFPPSTDIHHHPLVKRNVLVQQNKASCIPAAVLLDDVNVVRHTTTTKEKNAKKSEEEGECSSSESQPITYIIDACAAPGNKTTHMAAIGTTRSKQKNPSTPEKQRDEEKEEEDGGVKILALDIDPTRFELLRRRVESLGASDYINCMNEDFTKLSHEDRDAAEAILLDPSCSSSGNTTVSMELGTANAERVEKLAKFQCKMLKHALLSFPNVRRVVYSTCSVHVEENEGVVAQVLEDDRISGGGWTLSDIMPKEWPTRGVDPSSSLQGKSESETKSNEKKGEEALTHFQRCIRCDPAKDETTGFFVACFDRVL